MDTDERSCLPEHAELEQSRGSASSRSARDDSGAEAASFGLKGVASVVALAGIAGVAAVALKKATSSSEHNVQEARTVELGPDRSLHAVTAGTGPDIVPVHGAFANHRDPLDGPFADLAELGRVTAIDHPGRGLSRGPLSEGATGRTTEFRERGADIAKPIADLGARNMEAFVVSCKIAGRAAESLTREATEYGRKTFEDAFAMARGLTEVRSPADLIRLQSRFARTAFDNAMAFSNNLTETLTEMAGEVEWPSLSSSADRSRSEDR